MLSLSMTSDAFRAYVLHQANHFFPDQGAPKDDPLFKKAMDLALDRTFFCFKHIAMPAYNQEGRTTFSHLHSDQYTLFLWYLSNSVFSVYEDRSPAEKFFYLNKALNGVVCMYDAHMPNIFLILHGVGTMLGKATYNDFFVCCQGVTVGAVQGQYPVFGKGVSLLPGASVIGNCQIASGATFAANTMLNTTDLAAQTVYYQDRTTKQYTTRFKQVPWAQQFFNVPIPLEEA